MQTPSPEWDNSPPMLTVPTAVGVLHDQQNVPVQLAAAQRNLNDATAATKRCPRWQWWRRDLRVDLLHTERSRRDRVTKLIEEEQAIAAAGAGAEREVLVREVADQVISELVEDYVKPGVEPETKGTGWSRYSPRLRGVIAELTAHIDNAGWMLPVSNAADAQRVNARDIDAVAEHMNTAAVEARVNRLIEKGQKVASSPTLLSKWVRDDLVVQHKASGLRARFSPHRADTPGDRGVNSKPQDVPNIDPDAAESNDTSCLEWVGLGIGTRIYQEAARLLPDTRFSAGSVTGNAVHVRAKLHQGAQGAWQWEDRNCGWCTKRPIEWGTATASDFTGHHP